MNIFETLKRPILHFLISILIGLGLLLLILVLLFSSDILSGHLQMDSLSKGKMIAIQVLQMICLFVVPPIAFSYFSRKKFVTLYNLNKKTSALKITLSILIAILMFPVAIYLHEICMSLPWSANLKALAESQKAAGESVLKLFLDSPDRLNFILMISIVSLGASFCEELFFRGLLMPILSTTLKSIWWGIVLSGITFASFHLSVYDFIPYTLIGIFFAFIYYKTENLKITMIIHAFFNGMQVFLNYLYQIGVIKTDIEEDVSFPFYIAIPCLIAIGYLTYLLIKKPSNSTL